MFIIFGAVGAALTGGKSAGGTAQQAQATTSAINATASATVKVETTATRKPTPTSLATPSVASTPSATAVAVTGFGATDAEWNSHHVAAPTNSGLIAGCCYDPDPTLPPVNGHVAYRYYTVQHIDGRVLDYEIDLRSTTIADAKTQALREFPPDSSILWFAVKDSCAQMEIKSVTLGKALSAPAIGDSEGEAFVEFGTQSPDGSGTYKPSAINDIIVQMGSYATAADGPAC